MKYFMVVALMVLVGMSSFLFWQGDVISMLKGIFLILFAKLLFGVLVKLAEEERR